MVYDQQTDTMIITEFFQLCHNLIVAGIAVTLAAYLADFLQGVNDNQPDSGVSLDKFFKLLDRKSTRLNSSHNVASRMPSSA